MFQTPSFQTALDPDALLPDALLPDAQLPDALLPDTLLPDTLLPDALLPDALLPDALLPDHPTSRPLYFQIALIPDRLIIQMALFPGYALPKRFLTDWAAKLTTRPRKLTPC